MSDSRTPEKESHILPEDMKALANFCLMDDNFMRRVLKDNLNAAQHILRVVTGISDLVLTEEKTQEDMKRVTGARSICLDVYATDSAGRKYDLEIQRADKGAIPKRARYHSSVLDIENLKAKDTFDKLPETFTIFITEHDVFHRKQPYYLINRTFHDTNGLFDDEEHILYINGEYTGDDEIGHLMHDLKCSEPDDMYNADLAASVRRYKKTKGGQKEMGDYIDEQRQKTKAEVMVTNIQHLIQNMHMSVDDICKALEITPEEYQEYLKIAKHSA